MAEPFALIMRARWADMDFNQHMRNSAYLGCAEQCRMEFLAAHGWPMAQFIAAKLGPVVVEDRLTYRHELALLQEFEVAMELAAATNDARRLRLRNVFTLLDGTPCAQVDSVVLWFDLAARKPVVPPNDLREAWWSLPRSHDFEQWPPSARG